MGGDRRPPTGTNLATFLTMSLRALAPLGLLVALLAAVMATAQSGGGGEVEYRLGSGDEVRVNVFGEDDLSGQFRIDGSGDMALPLIGVVSARGLTLRELERRIERKLVDGYLVNPKVSIEVLNFRPFYILGEVNRPGSYPYVSGMRIVNAVALAGGYTYRAKEDRLLIIRAGKGESEPSPATPQTAVLPGDIIRVPERFF